jgi:organic hydroperoxide reductase OsmC/OhrA
MAHEYRATVTWKRESGATFTDQRYSRGHTWAFDGGITVPGSSSPHSVKLPYSVAEAVDPEEAFVAALSSCHMLTFLALASNKGFVVDSYEDSAIGHLEKNAGGKLAITRVELHPKIIYGGAKQPTPADLEWLHDKAHRECFIANSVTTEVRVAPVD